MFLNSAFTSRNSLVICAGQGKIVAPFFMVRSGYVLIGAAHLSRVALALEKRAVCHGIWTNPTPDLFVL